MPSVLYNVRILPTTAALALGLLTGACGGGQDAGNGAQVQIKDLETVDGTINDAMTDLDGVQSEGTALVETGGNTSSAARPATGAAQNASAPSTPDDDTEVVADQ
ncbi:hypothetical protein GCM10007897_15570 [Sphingobium jiangsuense]|uniref:Uncharacterized protein n=1 Tax=Sphingobium jiangsuense TaxID=870476 RepID=A0A7W6BH99_9SPHN|nr:hypothetical protein [Sphingobium jiangsuense]MBB3924996.1 hypothetical protein [Sphingobium jiangsuense]GLT00173.1 hypothetical protein GCM10007897_15570 [Sphingobium jiangsuense]